MWWPTRAVISQGRARRDRELYGKPDGGKPTRDADTASRAGPPRGWPRSGRAGLPRAAHGLSPPPRLAPPTESPAGRVRVSGTEDEPGQRTRKRGKAWRRTAEGWYTRRLAKADCLWVVGGTYILKATTENTDEALFVWEASVSARGGPSPHVYHHSDEAFYVLEGARAAGRRTRRRGASGLGTSLLTNRAKHGCRDAENLRRPPRSRIDSLYLLC